jgi:membrane fusion protein, heavy metal efflux system
MNIKTKFTGLIWLNAGLLSLILMACQAQTDEPNLQIAAQPKNEVILSPESQKHIYIKEAIVELTQRPLMTPATGSITYDETRTSRVSSPISGRVIGGVAELGAYVHKGDALVELDSPELGQAQSAYASATSDLNLASKTFQRKQELYANDVIPIKDLEQAKADLTRSRSEVERARLRLANLDIHTMRLDDRFILHAPISGTITERNINPGMEIRSDLTDPLFVISDLNQLWVQMDIYEKDIGLIHVGAKVLLHVPAYPDETFKATVSYIGQVVDETSRTVKVRCIVSNANNQLLPAMFASIEVQSDPDDMAVVVPLTALFTENDAAWLYVNTGNYHYQKRLAKVGLRLKDRAVILDGLKPGERLVVDGALLLNAEKNNQMQSKESTL